MAVTMTFEELYQTVCNSRIQSMKRRLEKGQRLEEPSTPCYSYMTFSCLILSPDYCKSLLYQGPFKTFHFQNNRFCVNECLSRHFQRFSHKVVKGMVQL